MSTEVKEKKQVVRKPKRKEKPPVYQVFCTIPDNLEEPKIFRTFEKACLFAMDLEGSIVKKNGKTVFRRAILGNPPVRLAMINEEARASRLKREEYARRHRELIEAEVDGIMDALKKAIVERRYYETLREEQMKNGDGVSMSISVTLDTVNRKVQANVSGSISLKHKATSSYEDPAQPGLFDNLDD